MSDLAVSAFPSEEVTVNRVEFSFDHFAQHVENTRAAVLRQLQYRFGIDPDRAEDLLQESMLRLMKTPARRRAWKVRDWTALLFWTTRNVFIDGYRQSLRKREFLLDADEDGAVGEDRFGPCERYSPEADVAGAEAGQVAQELHRDLLEGQEAAEIEFIRELLPALGVEDPPASDELVFERILVLFAFLNKVGEELGGVRRSTVKPGICRALRITPGAYDTRLSRLKKRWRTVAEKRILGGKA